MSNLSSQLDEVAEQVAALKRIPDYVTFNFFLNGKVSEIWPTVLEMVEKAIGTAPDQVKNLNEKPIEVTFDGKPCLVGREQAIALWDEYAMVLSPKQICSRKRCALPPNSIPGAAPEREMPGSKGSSHQNIQSPSKSFICVKQ